MIIKTNKIINNYIKIIKYTADMGGDASYTEGLHTTAQEVASHAEGSHTTAQGIASHAEGSHTTAQGIASHAEGAHTVARADFSHVEGANSLSAGIASHAEGNSTIASGENSHAEGYYTSTGTDNNVMQGNNAHAEGYFSKACGNNSHAEGNTTTAFGENSHVEGSYTSTGIETDFIQGNSAHAEGYFSKAYGRSAHAEGSFTFARGHSAHTQGLYTSAYGDAAHAEGNSTIASGDFSHAEGVNTRAIGSYSHTEGIGTTAKFPGAHIVGRYGDAQEAHSWFIGSGYSNQNKELGAKWLASTRNMYIDGNAYISNGISYAEMFETHREPIEFGLFVTLEGQYVRKATITDSYILGVTSSLPSILGHSAEMRWHAKYLVNEWGQLQYEEIEGTNGIEKRVVLNPKWDVTKKYISRLNRKEWIAVGLLGQIRVKDDGTCIIGEYCFPNAEGIATKADKGYRVIKRIAPYCIIIVLK